MAWSDPTRSRVDWLRYFQSLPLVNLAAEDAGDPLVDDYLLGENRDELMLDSTHDALWDDLTRSATIWS